MQRPLIEGNVNCADSLLSMATIVPRIHQVCPFEGDDEVDTEQERIYVIDAGNFQQLNSMTVMFLAVDVNRCVATKKR